MKSMTFHITKVLTEVMKTVRPPDLEDLVNLYSNKAVSKIKNS